MAKTVKAATLTEQVLKKVGGKGKKGSHKAGRNKVKCAAYLASGRREVNKAIKLARHMARYGTNAVGEVIDHVAHEVFKALPIGAKDVAKKRIISHRDRCVMGEVLAARRRVQVGG